MIRLVISSTLLPRVGIRISSRFISRCSRWHRTWNDNETSTQQMEPLGEQRPNTFHLIVDTTMAFGCCMLNGINIIILVRQNMAAMCEMKHKQTHQVGLATVDHPKASHQTLELKTDTRKTKLTTQNHQNWDLDEGKITNRLTYRKVSCKLNQKDIYVNTHFPLSKYLIVDTHNVSFIKIYYY